MAEMKSLIHKRGVIKSQLTRFTNFLDRLPVEQIDLNQLKCRLSNTKLLIDQFNDIQTNIELLNTETNPDEFVEERSEFENTYYSALSRAENIIETAAKKDTVIQGDAPAAGSQGTNSGINPISSMIKDVTLPVIKLTTFDGSFQNWLFFKDTFTSLIHNNKNITNIQRFHYLRLSLKGDAAEVIDSLEVSAENYDVAWQLLLERFENKNLLINNHVKSVFNLPAIAKESFLGLRSLLDGVTKHLRALKVLKLPVEQWDVLLIHLVASKLDQKTRREWEERCTGPDLPKFGDLEKFLKNKCRILENLQGGAERDLINKTDNTRRQKFAHVSTENFICIICKQNHTINSCPKFTNLPVSARWNEVKRLHLCPNCLRDNHTLKFCRASSCKKCNRRHHTILHDPEFYSKMSNNPNTPSPSTSVQSNQANINNSDISTNEHNYPECENIQTVTQVLSNQMSYSAHIQILLSTAVVQVLDSRGKIHETRALLDSGSQSNFVTESLCKKLKLPTTNIDYSISGISQQLTSIKSRCVLKIQSRLEDYRANLNCLILSKITDKLPSVSFNRHQLDIPPNIQLADPTFDKAGEIELLIGAEAFWDLICIGQIKLGRIQPTLQRTRLGWVVSGPLNNLQAKKHSFKTTCGLVSTNQIDANLTKFWELENVDNKRVFSREEQLCEIHFKETTQRDKDGRFIVEMPFKEPLKYLGESYAQAEKQFISLERRLRKDPERFALYSAFLTEYENMGHMVKIPDPDPAKLKYYMPHHGVYREQSETTKLRCVFNASAITSTGKSLNDLQMVGPVLQRDLFAILLNFRSFKYVVTGDIAKMYRQVRIQPNQTSLLRILWRANPLDNLSTYELQTVTYGTASASYLAVRCLFELAKECEAEQPQIAEIIRSDFYMDDLLTGADELEKTIEIATQVSNVLKRGCFELRKWRSNDKSIVQNLNEFDNSNLKLGTNDNSKTLGLIWSCVDDNFKFDIKALSDSNKITKRVILSETAQIFDPLGILSPCTVVCKIILKELWKEQLNWDSAVPSYLCYKWKTFRNELPILNNIQVSRHVVCDSYKTVQLHGFADSSEKAYGACVYVRSINNSGKISCKLLCAKSRVAPAKSVTIPRLELCAALLLARLMDKVKSSVKFNVNQTYYWSDSKITLSWIQSNTNKWQIFVANRIQEIQTLTSPNDWHYVPTSQNPADLLSRGVSPKIIVNCEMWWCGPKFLSLKKSAWPGNEFEILDMDNFPEVAKREARKTNNVVVAATVEPNFITNFSSLNRLVRVTAYCLRFKTNTLTSETNRNVGPLTACEIQIALNRLIAYVQNLSYQKELNELRKSKTVSSNSKLCSLTPFIDDDGILRVGGRLKNTNFDSWKKHPAILPSDNHLSYLIAENEHKRLLHAGPQLLLASLREKYWLIAGRNLVKRVVHRCTRCFRFNCSNVKTLMGDLPNPRVTPARAFLNCGVDYAGPIIIRDRLTRNYKPIKAYICLFVCLATKAVHLELVGDLTSESFLAALRRFMSRRGKCLNLYSDNGINFVAANSELRSFLQTQDDHIKTKLSQEGVSWHFIPPRAPHFGGLWEAGVKSVKFHLKRVIGEYVLSYEEFITVLTQVEACLNSRPLYPLSSDPNDPETLTPAHFLIGESLTTIPEPDLRVLPENKLSRFQRLQQITRHFWNRWSREYLGELQTRQKWRQRHQELLKPRTLVLLKEDNLPPLRWSTGRVLNTHPGDDDITRVVTIKTSKGVYKRPVTKVCVLPCESQSDI